MTAQKAPPQEAQQGCSRFHVCERRAGARYRQAFCVGDNVAADSISASMDHGVLTIILPYKTEQERCPRRIPVEGPPSPPASPPTGASEDAPPRPSTRPAPPAPQGGWVDVAGGAADDCSKGKAPADDGAHAEPAAEEDGAVEDAEY